LILKIEKMHLIEIHAPDFDLEKTLHSGQVFHWEKVGAGFVGTIGDVPVYVEQKNATLLIEVAAASSRCFGEHGQDAHATIAHYFALDHPLAKICASFPNDPVMNAARDFCSGLRIIRQPKWECLASFITSSMKQVAHIRQMSRALRQRFGSPKKLGQRIVHAFPPAARIASSSESELRTCALGYRAKNLLKTAQLVASGEADLEAWSRLSTLELGASLRQLPGVGPKVANCVMLFAYERLEAFPIDVWIERVLRERYRKRRISVAKLRVFAKNHFGEHGGYAQQYLFHHARTAPRPPGLERRQFVRGTAVR
jgi:N-glycosylase/DNA lyase